MAVNTDIVTAKKHVFTALEKKILILITKKSKYAIIENKKTDAVSAAAKNDAWDSIAREYNGSRQTTMPVTSKQLRRLWTNMKQREKEKRRQRLIGVDNLSGDPNNKTNDNDTEEQPIIVGCNEAVDWHPYAAPPEDHVDHLMERQTASEPSHFGSVTTSYEHHNSPILEMEYQERRTREEQLHELEIELLREKIMEAKARTREANAKADLAELILYERRTASADTQDIKTSP